jgi:type VI secretion system secreted protein VgrG
MSRLPPIQLRISFADGPDTEWLAVGLFVVEALNQLYEASVEIETEELSADTGELLGSTCELCMQRGELPPRYIYGVVARVQYLGQSDHHLRARVTLVPAFGLARQRVNSRIWQDTSVQDIVRSVLETSLAEYGRSVELGHLQRGTTPRDYCVQYRENDFAFVCRLLEESGISWFFVHDAERGHEVLTLCDDNDDYPRHVNVDGSATLPIIAHNPEEADVESLQVFEWARALTPTTVALSGYDPASPGSVAAEQHGDPDARGRVRRVYDHGLRRAAGAELGVRVRDHAEVLRMEGSIATCESNASLVGVGHVFTLDGVSHEGTPSEWIVVNVAHHFGLADSGVAGVYRNTLGCVPATVVLRPRELTPKPEVRGPQTATVVGGGEIDVDAQGRIQVQFHWQEQPSFSAGASCRVRCAQSWAGTGWGAQFIPRVGMEVVVEFLEGNPDRPLVTGCVYNGGNEPPFALPGNSTQSGWRSNSSPGGGGSNELRFEDAAGIEQIYVHGQKDWVEQIRNDASTNVGRNQVLGVGNDRETTIQHDRREQIGHDQLLVVGNDHSESVGANLRVQVGSHHSVTVGADQNLSVGHSRSESIGANAMQTVAQLKTVTVGGTLTTIVGGAMNVSVGALSSEEVGGVKSVSVGAASSESVVGGKLVEANTIALGARKDMSLSSGASTSVQVGKELRVKVDGALALHGKASGLIECDEDLVIKVGKASITLKKDGTIVLDGVDIKVEGKQAITLDAKQVNHN